MRPGLVLFDFDGTLADSFPFFVSVFNALAERHRFKQIKVEEVDSLRSLGGRELVKRLGVAWWRMPFIARDLKRRMAQRLDEVPSFDGIPALLLELDRAGVALAIVTSNSEENVRRVLGDALAGRVRHYACGVSLFGKAAAFRRVLRRAGVRAEDALCVGDELRDLEAAAAAGIAFGAVTWGYTTADALRARAPAVVFERVDEIARYVLAGSRDVAG